MNASELEQILKPPAKGFTKAEREWIKNVLIPGILTNRAIQGRNASVDNQDGGQVIGADDCAPCA